MPSKRRVIQESGLFAGKQYGFRISPIWIKVRRTYYTGKSDDLKLAKSYGHVGMKVTKQSQLKSTFEKTFAMKDQLVFVDVYVDPDEHVYPMLVAPNGSMKDMWIKKNTKA